MVHGDVSHRAITHSEHSINVDGHGDLPEPPYLEHLHHELGDKVWNDGEEGI